MSEPQKTVFAKIDGVVTRTLKYIAYVSAVCLLGIMLVAFFNVLGEKLRKLGLPVTGIPASTEIVQYLHIPVVFLAAAFVTLDRGHTRIDLLCAKFPKVLQKIFAIIGDLCGIVICALISYRGFIQMGKFISRHRMSSVSGVGFPLWPFALIRADDDMLEELDTRDACVKVRACVARVLDEREREVIIARYGLDGKEPRTQREVAAQCGISRSYISRIEKKALKKLEEAMERPDNCKPIK